jgi:hypothetical protein
MNNENKNSTKLKTNGYYLSSFKSKWTNYSDPSLRYSSVDTILNEVLFFKPDGFYFSYITLKGEVITYDDRFYDWNVFNKGRYFISGDTLKLISMNKSGQFKYVLRRTHFVIKDEERIEEIYFAWDDKTPTVDDYIRYQVENKSMKNSVFNFTESTISPESSKVWMLNHEWFWCDRAEFKRWKEKTNRKR